MNKRNAQHAASPDATGCDRAVTSYIGSSLQASRLHIEFLSG